MDPRRVLRSTCSLAAAGALVLLSAPTAAAHGNGDGHLRAVLSSSGSAAVDTPNTSDNVTHLTTVPGLPSAGGTAGISGCFLPTAPYFVTSGLESVQVFDVSSPRAPERVGVLDNAVFENEAMNCGERRVDGKVQRFALIGVDLYQESSDDPDHYNVGDNELILVNVTQPDNPRIMSRIPVSSSTHTVTCIDVRQCRTVYTAGSGGRFSVIDLDDLQQPREIDFVADQPGTQGRVSPVIGWAGHSWDADAAGYGLHTGADGSAVFDLGKPRRPRVLTTTGSFATEDGEQNTGWNDFIHHNSWRPHAEQFRPGARASLGNGNVLLVTEEDYEQTDCTQAGSFQTWKVQALRGPRQGIRPLDRVELSDLGTYPLPEPVSQGAFCSAHWFDYHPSGLVAAGFYGGGLQVIDVRNPREIESYGHAFWGASEVWDSYWVPRYEQGEQTGQTNIVYSVDLVRGIDVYAVDMPGGRSPGVAPSAAVDPGARPGVQPSALALALVALPLAVVLRRRSRSSD